MSSHEAKGGGRVAEVRRNGIVMRFAVASGGEIPYVIRPVLEGGYYEEGMLSHIRALGRKGAYIDVGAHVGTHSVWFALQCPATRVYSFEPVSRFAEMLRANIRLNSVDDRVTVVQIGLSDHPGSASNVLSSSHQHGFMSKPVEVTEMFEVACLDTIVRDRVAVLKLDVEGMEPAVLRGSRRILLEDSPVVFAEARNEAERRALFAELEPLGYRHTGRIFNATPTYEFRRPTRFWQPLLWRLRVRL